MTQQSSVCAFCTAKEVRERMITENDVAWVFPTNIPIVPGHILVVPRRCIALFSQLTTAEKEGLFELLGAMQGALKKTFLAEGFNIAWNEGSLAGQSIPHLHIHLLPRKAGDTGVVGYEPRSFIYRPGSRAESPRAELLDVSRSIRENL